MDHPQPAFDFLTSLPMDSRAEETIFTDWYTMGDIDAEKEDDIVDYPEVWDHLHLPVVLDELSVDDPVSLQQFTGGINLNASAIGLGLEHVRYEPEVFSGLVYAPSDSDATAIIFGDGPILAIGETEEATIEVVERTVDRLKSLGLADRISFDSEIETQQVSDYPSSEH